METGYIEVINARVIRKSCSFVRVTSDNFYFWITSEKAAVTA